jgi:hypothetical protein
MRLLVYIAVATAALGLAAGAISADTRSPRDQPSPKANIWVSAAGSPSCWRSATPIDYPTALLNSAVCDTPDHAYHAVANGGDTIRLKNGVYPGFVLTADSVKTSGTTIIRPESDYGVTLTSTTIFGPNVSYVTVKDFVVVAPAGGFQDGSWGLSRNVTIDGNRINIGQKVNGTPAAISFYSNIDGYKIVNNVIGPTCCGSTNQATPVGINIAKPNAAAPNATHVLIDGNTIQYTLRSCAYWPVTGYGACPDVTCVAATCHSDAIHIWGIQDSTISNNKIVNAEVQGIFIEDAAGAVNTNLSIVNNDISVVGGNAAMNLKGIAGTWTVAFDSTPNTIIVGYGFRTATAGTTVTLAGNDAILLNANSHGNNAGCASGTENVSLIYMQNLWLSNGGSTDTATCSGTDLGPERSRYGGLGAKSSSFYRRNPHGLSPPPPGLGYYTVDRTSAKRRVTGFHLELNIQPGFSPRERLNLLVRANLPDDAAVVNGDGDRCVAWRSQKLKKLIGFGFAVATTGANPSTAEIRAQSSPHC